MSRKHSAALLVLISTISINIAGCSRLKSHYAAHNTASSSPSPAASPAPSPVLVTVVDLAKLRWIVGTWRGTGGGVLPFYERYRFENESTLVVETLADESLSKVNDISRFVLMDGHFGYGNGTSGSVVIALDDNGITFAPLGKGNFFRWQRESDNSWKAILNWTDKSGAPKERVYLMERWPASNKAS